MNKPDIQQTKIPNLAEYRIWKKAGYPVQLYIIAKPFLGAKLLYNSLCPSVCLSVRPSVPLSETNQNFLVLTFALNSRSLHGSKIHFYLKVKVKVKEKISISP